MAASPLQRGSLYLYIALQLSLIIGNSAPVGYRMKQFRLLPVPWQCSVRQNKRYQYFYTFSAGTGKSSQCLRGLRCQFSYSRHLFLIRQISDLHQNQSVIRPELDLFISFPE